MARNKNFSGRAPEVQPTDKITDYVRVGTNSVGQKVYELRAAILERLPPSPRRRPSLFRVAIPTFRVSQPSLVLFAEGKPVLTLSGDIAETDADAVVTLTGNAQIVTADGQYRLNTYRLLIAPRRKRISTPDQIVITGPDLDGRGLGMIVDGIEGSLTLFGKSNLSFGLADIPDCLLKAMSALSAASESLASDFGQPTSRK